MKYGRLVFSREFVSSSTVCNVGDFVQTLAIDLLYKEMGIAKEDTVDIPFQSLASYKGEKVLLPLNGYFYYNREYPSFPLSEDITPVFLGLYTTSKEYLKHSSFWKNAGVIGCRDEATYEAVKKNGYDAYLTGCMTVLFPKREKAPENGKVFIVDAHPSIDAYIPEEIKKNAEEKGLAKDVEKYLQFFKYGIPPHGGFAIGVDRLTMLLLNLPSLKEAQFLFRGPDRLDP